MNKKIIALVIVAAILISIAALTLFKKIPNIEQPIAEVPVVNENSSATGKLEPTRNSPSTGLPPSDSDPAYTIAEEAQPTVTPEMEALDESEIKEATLSDIEEENGKIEKAKKEAANNPAILKVPMETQAPATPKPQPKADANGYIYTKEQAVENFKVAYQKKIDTNSYSYAGILAELMEEPNFSKEDFDSDVQKMMNDPYSSKILSECFEDYRKDGDLNLLLGACAEWLGCGGDDGKYAVRITR